MLKPCTLNDHQKHYGWWGASIGRLPAYQSWGTALINWLIKGANNPANCTLPV
jgi:hypothetical protein